MLGGNRQIGAGRETRYIERVDGGPGFVEVVDSPNEPALFIAPGAEVLDVQVADSENRGSFGQLGANFRPELEPAVKRRAKEGKSGVGHVLMLQSNVLAHDGKAFCQPALEVGGRFEDVHLRKRIRPMRGRVRNAFCRGACAPHRRGTLRQARPLACGRAARLPHCQCS